MIKITNIAHEPADDSFVATIHNESHEIAKLKVSYPEDVACRIELTSEPAVLMTMPYINCTAFVTDVLRAIEEATAPDYELPSDLPMPIIVSK